MIEPERPLVQFSPWPKQQEIFHAFFDNTTTEVLYGGSVNCGKSFCLCAFLLYVCTTYPKTVWLLGRSELKVLKQTTLISFFEVCEKWNIKRDEHFTYNEVKGEIDFWNGSKILLRDLFYYPSDPDCISLNGLQLTGACIDEAGELDERVKNIVSTRVGRWKNTEYKIKPFLLMTCNPSKKFLYTDFYKPHRDGTLATFRKFIPTTMSDIPEDQRNKQYEENLLRTITERDHARLVLGKWEYDDLSDSIIPFNKISELWQRTPILTGTKYISADIALEGSDKLVFMVWDGLTLIKILAVAKSDSVKVLELLKELAQVHQVPERNICYDYDGLGQFIKGFFPGAKAIVNNARAKLDENYENLKSQMYFKLAQMINEGKIVIADNTYKTEIVQELEQVRKKDSSLDRKVGIVSKAVVKQAIGRSPDFADCLAYRMLFELLPANHGKVSYIIGNLNDDRL